MRSQSGSRRPLRLLACTAAGAFAAGVALVAQAAAHPPVTGPLCLPQPAAINTSAQLPGSHVLASPGPGSGTADPATQLSFLGAPVRVLSVLGSQSGTHAGSLRRYSQGDGSSFVPTTPFSPGEKVSVRVAVGGKDDSYSFTVDTPWSTAGVGAFPNPTPPASDYQTFVTLPGVQAPILTVTSPDTDPAAGDILTSNGPGPGRYGPLIYSPQGRLIWFDQLPTGLVGDDLAVQSYKGQRDLTFWEGKVLSLGYGVGEDLILNSRYQVVATIKGGNGLKPDLHELQLGANGVAYVTAYNAIRCSRRST
jgi:hypothetical protein